jgi:Zn-dependent protease with chaperone function
MVRPGPPPPPKPGRPDWKLYAMAPLWVAKRIARENPDMRREFPGSPPYVWMLTLAMGVNPISMLISTGMFLFTFWKDTEVFGHGFGHVVFALLVLVPLMFISGLIPLLTLGYGSLQIFFPSRRKRAIEKRFELKPLQLRGRVLGEIAAFVAERAPDVALMDGLKHSQLLAFVYPDGAQDVCLAVCGGLVLLWQRDRQAAEAVIIHELAHFRRGEALHLGHGSGVESALRIGAVSLAVALGFWLLVGLLNVRMLAIAISSAAGAFGVYLVLVAAFWCAEFQADRMAAEELGSSEGLLRALALGNEGTSAWGRFLARLTHPPLSWRRALLQAPASKAYIQINLVFLAGLLLKDALLLLSMWTGYWALGGPLGLGATMTYDDTLREVTMGGKAYLVMGIFIWLWPYVHYRYVTSFTRERTATLPSPGWPRWVVGGLVSLAWLLNLVLMLYTYDVALGAPTEKKVEIDFQNLPGLDYNLQIDPNLYAPDSGILQDHLQNEGYAIPEYTAPEDYSDPYAQPETSDGSSESGTVWDSFENYEGSDSGGSDSGGSDSGY